MVKNLKHSSHSGPPLKSGPPNQNIRSSLSLENESYPFLETSVEAAAVALTAER
jgi:hypothetical protein